MSPKGLSILSWMIIVVGCGTSNTEDAGVDGAVVDVVHDTTSDVSYDAPSDVSHADAPSDAPDDDASDASEDVSSDGSDDASPADAGLDSSDAGGPSDGGLDPCLKIACTVMDKCCNNAMSVNYGKCEPITCSSCCL